MTPGGPLCAQTALAVKAGMSSEAHAKFEQLKSQDSVPTWLKTLLPKLQAILMGSRDPALADDPALDYDDAAELILLLETLEAEGL